MRSLHRTPLHHVRRLRNVNRGSWSAPQGAFIWFRNPMPHCFNISDIAGEPRIVFVSTNAYTHGGLVVQLIDELYKEQYATVSIYVRGVRLADDEFVFKTYSENEGLLESMLKAGIVEETGRSVVLSFGEPQPICRLIKQ